MKSKHQKTLQAIFKHPISANINWADIEALLKELGALIVEAEGSRVRITLFNEVKVYHRPHPRPHTNKGAVANVRHWLETNGVTP